MKTATVYQFRIKEQLDEQWAEWFFPLHIQKEANGNTTFSGPIRDQAELYGIIIKMRDLNLTLLTVKPVDPPPKAV